MGVNFRIGHLIPDDLAVFFAVGFEDNQLARRGEGDQYTSQVEEGGEAVVFDRIDPGGGPGDGVHAEKIAKAGVVAIDKSFFQYGCIEGDMDGGVFPGFCH